MIRRAYLVHKWYVPTANEEIHVVSTVEISDSWTNQKKEPRTNQKIKSRLIFYIFMTVNKNTIIIN